MRWFTFIVSFIHYKCKVGIIIPILQDTGSGGGLIITGHLVIKQVLPRHLECAQQTPWVTFHVFPWSLTAGSKEKSHYGGDVLGERPASLRDGQALMAAV